MFDHEKGDVFFAFELALSEAVLEIVIEKDECESGEIPRKGQAEAWTTY